MAITNRNNGARTSMSEEDPSALAIAGCGIDTNMSHKSSNIGFVERRGVYDCKSYRK